MSECQRNEWDRCDFCKRGKVIFRNEHLRFRQDSPKGLLHCQVDIAIGRCDVCGFAHVDAEADAAIRAEVDRARRALA